MKKFYLLLLTFVLTFAGNTTSYAQNDLQGEELVNSYLANGGVFRIYGNRNSQTNRVMAENTSNQVVVQSKASKTNMKEMWILEKSGTGYTLRNVDSGRFIQNQTTEGTPHETGESSARFYIKYSAANAEGGEFVTISNKSDYTGNVCFLQNSSNKVVLGDASDAAACWRLEPVTDCTTEDIIKQMNGGYYLVSTPTAGEYYRIRSKSYADTANDTVDVEHDEQRELRFTIIEEQELRIHRPQSGDEEKDARDDKRLLAAKVCGQETRKCRTDDTSNQGACRCESMPAISVCKILCFHEERLKTFFCT